MSNNCEPNEETHKIGISRGVGCTKESAKAAIISTLLRKAESERETKCEKLECCGLESGKCVTTLDPDDVIRIEKDIKLYPIRRKDCPGNIGWLAWLPASNPKYKSECICVPDE